MTRDEDGRNIIPFPGGERGKKTLEQEYKETLIELIMKSKEEGNVVSLEQLRSANPEVASVFEAAAPGTMEVFYDRGGKENVVYHLYYKSKQNELVYVHINPYKSDLPRPAKGAFPGAADNRILKLLKSQCNLMPGSLVPNGQDIRKVWSEIIADLAEQERQEDFDL